MKIPFGKYKREDLDDIILDDPEYILRIYHNDIGSVSLRAIIKERLEIITDLAEKQSANKRNEKINSDDRRDLPGGVPH